MAVKKLVRIGVVQPKAWVGEEAPRNLQDALGYSAEAERLGVDLLLFPETYPGPTSHQVRFEVVEPLREAAARHRVAVALGTTEKVGEGERDHNVVHVVIDANGVVKGRYRRTHPRDEVYRGLYQSKPMWDIDYVAGDDFPVFDLGWGKVGVSICSEVFVPEVARTLALNGAEICLFPTGVLIEDLGFSENWLTLIRARAIENLMFTATTMNLFSAEVRDAYCGPNMPPVDQATGLNQGHAMIASPERILGRMNGPGILTADCDLERIRLMRRSREFPDGLEVPPPFATLPGVFLLRRPELADRMATSPDAVSAVVTRS